jgi:exodeoxyribonuclease VII large subunit
MIPSPCLFFLLLKSLLYQGLHIEYKFWMTILDQNQKMSNIPEFSVSDLAGSLKRTLEESYGRVRVRGELSRVTVAGSGHLYSSLKDDGAVIDAVCWKGTLSKLSVKPEEGLEVICTGRITTYPQRSNYQLVIESMELAGEGALLKMLEDRKKKLAAEGLFDSARKHPLPFLPEVIGVITSPTGAVINDIRHRLKDRFPRRVLVWPVLVQGANAAEQVANAIHGFNALPEDGPIPRPDLLIVARGGGSLEDLMPFNEEIVVRAASVSAIPLISAVGHETDTTLLDYAADARAPTPTGAAEMAVPRRDQLLALMTETAQRLTGSVLRLIGAARERMENLRAHLGSPARLLENKTQALDRLSLRIDGLFTQYLYAKDKGLQQKIARLPSPVHTLERGMARLDKSSDNLTRLSKTLLKDRAAGLENHGRLLESLSFKKTLERGFVVVRKEEGGVVSNADLLHENQSITLQFHNDRKIKAVVK